MTYHQALAFGLVVVTIACFIWGRFRYDLVSLLPCSPPWRWAS